MNDKQQIEEICKMAVLGCRRNPQAHTVEECVNCDFKKGSCDFYRLAEKLYEENYRKIPEDSVVMAETERITMCAEQWDKGYAQARTETARECRDFIKQWVGNDEEGLGFLFDFEEFIKKQYGVEVDE